MNVWTWMAGEIFRFTTHIMATDYILPCGKFKRLPGYTITPRRVLIMHFYGLYIQYKV